LSFTTTGEGHIFVPEIIGKGEAEVKSDPELTMRCCSSDFGHDKSLEIKPYAALKDRPVMFYAGDGVSDLSAAKETDLLFAKAGRGKHLLIITPVYTIPVLNHHRSRLVLREGKCPLHRLQRLLGHPEGRRRRRGRQAQRQGCCHRQGLTDRNQGHLERQSVFVPER
jgi:hypothetical protein